VTRELELKYSVKAIDEVRALVGGDQLAGLAASPWRVIQVRDQYLDTASGALARAGYGARLRHGDGTMLTVKDSPPRQPAGRQAQQQPALHDRLELEGPATGRLDPRHWPESPARALVEATAGGERLRTLFVLEQRREERDLERDGRWVATLSLDHAEVRRLGRRVGEFSVLEIESVEPDRRRARRLLDQLAAAVGGSALLEPEPRSKEQLALDMIERGRGAWHAPRPPRRPGVTADDTLAEAGRKVLRMHLLRMLAAEAGVRAGAGTEPVHKMRVATRRMRAAWRVFGGAFSGRSRRRYVEQLRRVARALGGVRDIDVQLERLAGYRASLGGDAAARLEPLAMAWLRRRTAAQHDLLRLLDSSAYERFVIAYLAFAESPAEGAGTTAAVRLRDVAGGRTWRAYERMRAHDAFLERADAPAIHQLRIDGKRLRYTLEFLAEILPPDSQRAIADVTALQDHLGLLNDAQIAADLTRAWLTEEGAGRPPAERQAAAAYAAASEREAARLRRTLGPLWRRLTGPTFRRRLGLIVSAI
jgi:CHAD domain-containing protein